MTMVMKMMINLTGTNLDLILIIIFALSIFIGLKNGFIDTLIRFVLTVLVFFGAWYLSTPISYFVPLPELQIEANILTFIEPMLQKIIAFVGIFIILSIIKNIIYILIKPTIKKIVEFFKIIDVADRLLGLVFNVAKNIIITSLLLACLNLPFFTNGEQILNESKGANLVIKMAPEISEQVVEFSQGIVDFTQVDAWANQEFSTKEMVYVLNAMNNFDVLTDEHLNTFYQQYTYQITLIPNATVSKNEYEKLQEMITALPGNEDLKTLLKNKISY